MIPSTLVDAEKSKSIYNTILNEDRTNLGDENLKYFAMIYFNKDNV